MTLFISIIIVSMLSTNPSFASDEKMCGPNSLLSVCQTYGMNITIEEILELTDYNPETGTTMLNLYEAALELDLHVLPRFLSIDQLCMVNKKGIVYVDDSHFMVFHKCDINEVFLQDYPKSPFWISKKEFSKQWTGEVLVFLDDYNKEQTHKKMSDVLTENRVLNLGTVREGEEKTIIYNFENHSDQLLKIHFIRSMCSCTNAIVLKNNIPPGEMGEIKIIFNSDGFRSGKKSQKILMKTNDKNNPSMILYLIADIIAGPSLYPEKIWLGELSKGEIVEKDFKVIGSSQDSLKILDIKLPVGFVSKIGNPRSSLSGKYEYPIKLKYMSPEKPGVINESIEIVTNNTIKKNVFLNVTGKVLSQYDSTPSRIFLPHVKQGEVTVFSTRITGRDNTPVDELAIHSANNLVLINNTTMNSKSSCDIFCSLPGQKINSVVRDTVFVFLPTQKDPIISIPVTAIVNQK